MQYNSKHTDKWQLRTEAATKKLEPIHELFKREPNRLWVHEADHSFENL